MIICPALFVADYIEKGPVIFRGLLGFVLLLTFQVRATNWFQSGQDPLRVLAKSVLEILSCR